MWTQCLNSVEDAADVKAADQVQAELSLLSDVSSQSELKKLPPSRRRVHRTSTNIGLSQVADSDSRHLSITDGNLVDKKLLSLHLNEEDALVASEWRS